MIKNLENENNVEATRVHYNAEAESYDEVYTHPIQLAEDQVLMGIIKPFVTKGQKVLDIGCGTGLPLTYLNIPQYYGIDISSGMVDKAQADHPDGDFQVADMHHLPFEDTSIDTVMSLFGPLSYSLEPDKVILELLRVLKPGGMAIIMPYTQRVGYELDMGGYSTANATDTQKKFYDTQTLQTLFSHFTGVKILGMNYFGNALAHYSEVMGGELTQEDYQMQLQLELANASKMPDVKYARHSIVIAKKPHLGYRRCAK